MLARRLGWRGPRGVPLPLHKLRARIVTWLQEAEVRGKRSAQVRLFVAEALGQGEGDAADEAVRSVYGHFEHLWGLRWEKEYLEPWWRLVQDGYPDFGNSHYRGMPSGTCPCGVAIGESPRGHHFWECAVAKEVYRMVAAQFAVPAVSKAQAWLLDPPSGANPLAWAIIGLACVYALAHARLEKYRYMKRLRELQDGDAEPEGGQDFTQRIAQEASVRVLEALTSFTSLDWSPKGWAMAVPTDHPMLSTSVSGYPKLNIRG